MNASQVIWILAGCATAWSITGYSISTPAQVASCQPVQCYENALQALQAAQAGNQLLALQSQQLSDVAALLASKARADALEQARTAAAEAQGQQQYQAFAARSGYVPHDVTMFSGN